MLNRIASDDDLVSEKFFWSKSGMEVFDPRSTKATSYGMEVPHASLAPSCSC